MKNTVLRLSGFILMLILSFSSCRKGENDPIFSFMSRDARVTGIWKLTDYSKSEEDVSSFSGTTTTTTSTTTYDGTILTETSGGSSSSFSYSLEITINEDGTYDYIEVNDGDKIEYTGYWNWVDDTKNKIKIELSGSVFEITQLKNNEMVLNLISFFKDTGSDGDYTQSTEEEIFTFTKQ